MVRNLLYPQVPIGQYLAHPLCTIIPPAHPGVSRWIASASAPWGRSKRSISPTMLSGAPPMAAPSQDPSDNHGRQPPPASEARGNPAVETHRRNRSPARHPVPSRPACNQLQRPTLAAPAVPRRRLPPAAGPAGPCSPGRGPLSFLFRSFHILSPLARGSTKCECRDPKQTPMSNAANAEADSTSGTAFGALRFSRFDIV